MAPSAQAHGARDGDPLASGGARILVDETVEPLPAHDQAALRDGLRIGRAEAQTAVRSGPVVMVDVLVQDLDQVALAQDDQPVQTLSPQDAKYPLAGSVRAGGAEWRSDDPDAGGGEDRVEGSEWYPFSYRSLDVTKDGLPERRIEFTTPLKGRRTASRVLTTCW
jgi:hypothetical protein